jgi:methionine synthase II (cobalamin-independent)
MNDQPASANPSSAPKKSITEAALDVLGEFVRDVEVAYGVGKRRDRKVNQAAMDWPDLVTTFHHAREVLRAAADAKPDKLAITIICEGGVVQDVLGSVPDVDVDVVDYDNAKEDGTTKEVEKAALKRIAKVTPHAL